METSLLAILPQLSIGVISVLALVFVVIKFLDAMDQRTMRHEEAMKERETSLRTVEKEVRATLSTHLTESTHAVRENTKVLERVVMRLDSTK
jgi:hypothetical protein